MDTGRQRDAKVDLLHFWMQTFEFNCTVWMHQES